MKGFLLISAIALFTSCKQVSSQSIINRAKSNSEVKDKLKEYQAQPHRLAFNGDHFSYNEQPFQFGNSIKELVAIFGDYDYHNLWYFVWEKQGIVFGTNTKTESLDNKVDYIYEY